MVLQELKQRGIIPKHKIVGMRMMYDTKTRDGIFDKAKNRYVVQGHKEILAIGTTLECE